jgi:hypothetical protein
MNERTAQALKRVGECLYRHHTRTYYALVKVAGKQIKRSLRTADVSLAKRRLSDFRNSATRLGFYQRLAAQRNPVWLALVSGGLLLRAATR